MYPSLLMPFLYAFAVFLCVGCGSRTERDRLQPVIYDAWDARYHYDPETRRMLPVHNEKLVGKAWGRDEKGRLNYSEYLSGSSRGNEDLLALYKRRLNAQRDNKWEIENQARIESIKQNLDNFDSNKTKEKPVEDTSAPSLDNFLPPAFIPIGIDGPSTPSPADDIFMPMSPGGDAAPAPDAPAEPSPFEPLAPLP